MIRSGRVTVDGRPAHLGQKIDVTRAQVEVDGIPLPVRPGLVYYVLYKPAGVLSTAADPGGRRTVVDLVPSQPRVYPVGRLDADSEGLLLLTNDGELTNLITHPRYGIDKAYVAKVRGVPARSRLRRLTDGIELEDGPARAASARLVDSFGGEALVEVVMEEGRKREVRRMLDALGHPVLSLVRTRIGPLVERDLAPGEYRALTTSEVRALYGAARR
jgi:23S rRNA pseudouridine2605 synthase